MSGEYLRLADEQDTDFLFHLANDGECRRNSFDTHIISYPEHKSWFYNKLTSPDSRLYIYINEEGLAAGQARLDFKKNKAYISYSIVKEFRGRGHGKRVIELIENEAGRNQAVDEICARVKSDNEASKHIFEQYGYTKIEQENYIDYRKEIR